MRKYACILILFCKLKLDIWRCSRSTDVKTITCFEVTLHCILTCKSCFIDWFPREADVKLDVSSGHCGGKTTWSPFVFKFYKEIRSSMEVQIEIRKICSKETIKQKLTNKNRSNNNQTRAKTEQTTVSWNTWLQHVKTNMHHFKENCSLYLSTMFLIFPTPERKRYEKINMD